MNILPLTSKNPLSKSRFVHGIQCPRWLYYAVRTDAEPREFSPGEENRLEMGNIVGELARQHLSGGVMVTADHLNHADAVRQTAEALASGAPLIYEATFDHHRTKVRIDILRNNGDGTFDLIEVKSTKEYKKAKHLRDAAVQLYVARGAGIDVRRVYLMHLSGEYVWPGGPYDLEQLFVLTDITAEAEERLAEVPAEIDRLLAILDADAIPDPGESSCASPLPCPFEQACREGEPEHPLRDLPRLGNAKKLRRELKSRGFTCVEDIDEATATEFLTEARFHAWECVKRDGFVFADGIEEWLDQLEYPLYYLDFETINAALPLIVGTSPYDVIPLQWSLHVQREPGAEPEHLEYLVPGGGDHRRELAERLLDALGTAGTVLEYHGGGGYESKRLEYLAELYPDLAPRIEAVLARMRDLGELTHEYVFHPDMHGRWSIKLVQPLLAPDLPEYKGLAVSNGDEAMVALYELLDEKTGPERREALRRDLLEYCAQDTMVMVKVLYGVRRELTAMGL